MFSPWSRYLFLKPRQSTKPSRKSRKIRPWTSALYLENLEERLAPATLDWIGVNTVGSSAQGLNGAYYNINPATLGMLDATGSITGSSAAWLGNPANNYTPAVTAILTGPIDFPNIAVNGFQDTSGTTYYNLGNGNNNNVEARWTGQIAIPNNGNTNNPITFSTVSDDGSVIYIDGNLVVSNDNFQGANRVTNTVNLTPGVHNIDIEYLQGTGGATMDAQWDPTGGTNLVDIPNSVFSIPASVGDWSNAGNWVNTANQANQVPQNGDTVVFNSSVTGTGAYTAFNDLPGLTLNGIVVQNTGTTPYVITGNAVSIDNTDPTLTSGISDASTTTTVLGLTSIALGANTNIDNTSAFPASVTSTPSLLIASNIDMAGNVLSSGPSFADAVSGTPDTGLTEISGVVSSSVANTDAVLESGYGVLALAGNNTYDGTTSVFNGLLVAAANNSLGATTGGAKTVNPTANPLPLSPGAALGIGLGGDNAAYTNGVTIQGAGPSVLGGALWSAASSPSVFNAPITLAGATTFNINSGGSLSLGGALNLSSNALTITGNDNLTLSGVITGTATSSITDTDSATTTLSGNNTPFLGPININAGILAAGANNALGVGTGAVTVASGAALGLTNNVNYTTAQTVSITGSGPGGNGAVEGLSGTNSFAGTITVSSGDEYLGAIGGTTTLSTPINLATNNLFLVGSGGNLTLSGAITGPTTSTITQNGTGTDTIAHNNSAGFAGSTVINQGVLAVAANGALGNGSGSVTVNSGGGLGLTGDVTYATVQPVSIAGIGTIGNGAIENLSGTNSFAGPLTLAGNSTIGSDAGTLTLSGNIALNGWSLTATGAGSTTVSSIISGTGSTVINNALNGAYFASSQLTGNTPGDYLFNPANTNYIGDLVPSIVTPTAQINFSNISGNSFAPYANVGGTNVAASWTGFINITQTGTYDFESASDDDSVIYIATSPGQGQPVNYTTPVVNNVSGAGGHASPGPAPTGSVTFTTTGLYAIEVDYWQGGGGASEVLTWDPTGMGNYAVIPASAFSFNSPGTNAVVKTGSGTLTLSGNNTYAGTTTISAGTVVAANNNALGSPTGGGVTVNIGADLALPATGGITLSAAKTLTLNGAGPIGNGAIENLGGANTVASTIQLGSSSSIGSDGNTLTVAGSIALNGETLTATGAGNTTISGVISGSNSARIPGLNGQYYDNITVPGNGQGAELGFLSTLTPAVSEILTGSNTAAPNSAPAGSMINLTDISQAANDSFTDALTAGGAPGPNFQPPDSIAALWSGNITIPATAGGGGTNPVPITFLTGSDDGSTVWIDGNQVVFNDMPQGVNYRAGIVDLVPGSTHSIIITYYQGGGGASMFLNWDLTGNTPANYVSGNPAGVPIPASAFSIPANGVTKNGIGTLTLSNTNNYIGATTINAGVVVPTVDGAMGPATAAGIIVNAGGTLAFTGGLTYATAEPTTISGSGLAGNGAIVNNSGTNSFAAPITLAANATIGSIAGTLTLSGSTVSLAAQNLTTTGAGNLIISDTISDPTTTNQLIQAGTGTTTLSGNNTYAGLTSVNLGTLIADSPNALGATTTGTVVASSATLGIEGGIALAAEPLTIGGTGVGGVGAFANVSGNNSFAGPISLATNSTIGSSTAGNTLTLGGNFTNGNATAATNLTFTGAGNLDVTGAIQTSPPVSGELLGNYYTNVNTVVDPLNPASTTSMFFQTPTVTEPLTGSNTAAPNNAPTGSAIVLNQISQAANDSFADALTTGGASGPNFQPPDNIGALWTGLITIPSTAGGGGTAPVPITFFTASDDGSVIYIDGTGAANLVVNNDFSQGVTYRAGQVDLVPGSTHTITIGYFQGGGGAAAVVDWDLTGGNFPFNASGNAPGGAATPIPISAFSYQPPGIANVVKNGSGTVTLASATGNTYTGSTTINGGDLQVGSNAELGQTAGSTVTINAATLEATGTFSSTHNYVLGNSASAIQVDAGKTLTIPTAITGTGALTTTGPGTLALTANNTYPGGTTDSAGVIAVSGALTPLGTGTLTLAGGNLSLLGNQVAHPVALTGFNQDVIWGSGEVSPTVGTTTSLDGAGNVLYDTTVFSPGGGLPANGVIVSQSNPAVAFQLQPYTASNVLLATDTAGHTLTLANPGQYQTLSILDLATNGAATYTLTLNFQDGTSDSTTFTSETAPDWFTTSGEAIGGLGRVSQTSPTFSGLPNSPSMFEQDLTLPAADQAKVLASLTFTRLTGGTLGVFAVSGTQPQQIYSNSVVTTVNAAIDVENEPATLGSLSIGGQTLSVTTAGTGTSLTLGATTLTGNPTFSPAATVPLNLGALNDGGTARTITITGPTTLTSPASSLVNGTTVNVTGGALNSNNATALGTLATVAVSPGASFNLGASQTIGSLNGAGTVNLDGNTLTVGSSNNLASTFSGVIADGTGTAGSGGLVKAGSGSLTIAAGISTYTGPTADNAGILVVNGSLTATTVTVASGATLRGTGTVSKITASSGGQVEPGAGAGALSTSNVALASGSTFTVDLGGTSTGHYDQLVVSASGSVNLNSNSGTGATLVITPITGFLPAVGNTFTIINNQGTNPISGTFAQGSTYTANGYTYSISYTGGTNHDSVVLTVVSVPGPVTHFVAIATPTSITAGGSVSFTVTALDANNDIVPTYTGTVSFTSTDGQAVFPVNNYTFTSGGPTSDDGVHTFTAILETAGSQTIEATDLSNNTGTTNAITVTAGPFSKYDVSFPAGNTVTAGSSFTFTVEAADQYGNVVNGYTGPSSVAVASSPVDPLGSIPTSVTLNSAGVGTSVGTLKTAGSYTIDVTGTQGINTFTGASSALTVNAGTPASIVATSGSSQNVTVNGAFGSMLAVKVLDQYGNPVPGVAVTFAAPTSGASATFGTASGTTNVSGQFSTTVTANTVAGSYTVTAAVAGVSTPVSFALTNNPATASKVAFGVQPGNTAGGAAINPAVQAAVEDQFGNVLTSDQTDQVTLAVASGPGGFTAGSTLTATVHNGVATFSNLVLDTAGTYQLSDSVTGGLTGANSSAFNVTLAVTSFTATPTGFTAAFSQPFNNTNSGNTAQLNLYNSSSSNDGAADVTLVSNTTGKAVTGSLVISSNNQTITFIKTTEAGTNGLPLSNTWGLLPADTYTATLVSGSQAFETAAGLLLDGLSNGTSGSGNYAATFTVSPLAANAVVVTVPDFARGPDSTDLINVPNNSSPAVGIPIDLTLLASTQTVAFSSGVTGGTFRLTFNGSSTGAITWSSNTTTLATNIKNGLAALANVGTGNVSVSVAGSAATVTFAATVANPSLMTVSVNSLTPSGSTITITDPNAPANVTNATFTLDYNASLLTISGGTVNSSLSGATFTVATSGAGSAAQATITFHSTAGVNLGTLGSVLLGGLTATVPTNAQYKSLDLLHFDLTSGSNNTIDGGTVPVVTSDGLHVVAFPGDATGLGGSAYTSADSVDIVRVAGKADSGFGAFPIVDPVIIGDLSDNGLMDSGDATILNSVFTGGNPAQLPPYAGPASNNPSGPDPTVSIPTDLSAGLGGIVTVPVNIDDPVPGTNAGMTEATLALKYDPSVLSVSAADVSLGTVPASGTGWTLQVAVNQATGELGITLFSSTPITDPAGGSLVTINFHVNGTAVPGATAINLVSAVNPSGFNVISTMVADTQGAFTLSSGPTGGATSANGIVTILAPTPVSVSVAETAPAELAAMPPSESVSAVEVVEALLPPTPPVVPVTADGRAEEALTSSAPMFPVAVSNVSATVLMTGVSPALQPVNLAPAIEDNVPADGDGTMTPAADPLAAALAPTTDGKQLAAVVVETPAANAPASAPTKGGQPVAAVVVETPAANSVVENNGTSGTTATDQGDDSAFAITIPTFAALRSKNRGSRSASPANVFALDAYFARVAEELKQRDAK